MLNVARALYGETITASEASDPNSAARRAAAAHAAGREVSSDRATLERDGVQQLLTRLQQLRREILGVLAGASGDFRRFTSSSLIADIDALIAEANADLARLAQSSITTAADLGQAAVDQPVKAARVGIPLGAGPGLDAALVTAAFDNAADLLTAPMQQFRNQIVRGVRAAALAGGSSAEQMAAVAASIDGAGGFSNAAFSAERALRTELGRTLNTATFARLEELARELTFLRKGWRAAKDGRTRQGHIEAAAKYARGSGIPIAEKFLINVYQEYPNKPGATRSPAKLLGVASLRYPIDPDTAPAGRLAAGATILCRCNAFVDFNLSDLTAYSVNRARGTGSSGAPSPPPVPLPPEPVAPKAKRTRPELTAEGARAKLQKLENKRDLDRAVLGRQATDAYERWYEYNAGIDRRLANGEAVPAADLERIDALLAGYKALMAKIDALAAATLTAQRRVLYVEASARRSISARWNKGDAFGQSVGTRYRYTKSGKQIATFTIGGRFEARKRILDGFREAEKLTGAGSFGGDAVLIKRVRKADGSFDNRANASQRDNAINLDQYEDTQTVVHELGHMLEFNSPDIQAAAFRFYERRTAGDPLRKLKDLKAGSYEDHEVVREDKWANVYAGKEYMVGGHRYATEIMSMGLENFYARPAAFAKEDPDFFDFIYNALRGRFR